MRHSFLIKALVILILLAAIIVFFSQSFQAQKAYDALAATTPVPSVAPPPLSYREQAPMFRIGSLGPEVIALQQRLSQLGYYTGELDGKYYEGTAAAVKNFQLQNNLDADGIAGEMTLQALSGSEAKPYDPNFVTPTPQPVP